MKKTFFRKSSLALLTLSLFSMAVPAIGLGQGVQCDPSKVMTAEACAKCHHNEVRVWKQTPHFKTFEELSRQPEAKQICNRLGLNSVKRSGVCIQCHYTTRQIGDRIKPVSGISCESCHGASKDWLTVHNDYGGPTATRESESPADREQRFDHCLELGMRNTRNLYLIASSCFKCHTVPNESLVNTGGHTAGTDDFELVAWSQGQVRHNFLRTDGQANAESTLDRLRVMFVVGLLADLEYSTRATALATSKSKYGLTVANRAARVAVQLYRLQQEINDPDVQAALQAFAGANLKINNTEQLNQIADEIKQAGMAFAKRNDGAALTAVDAHLPDPRTYR